MAGSLIFQRQFNMYLLFHHIVRFVIFFVISNFAFSQEMQSNDKKTDIYTLGSGDKMQITVFAEKDLSVERTINGEGDISYPLLGTVRVQGMAVKDLESELTRLLKGDYLIDPKVNVNVVTYRQFFVRGEVKKPGGFPFLPGLTVDTCVALAGGFTARASQKNIKISREQPDGSRLDVDSGLADKILPGDILIVNESFF